MRLLPSTTGRQKIAIFKGVFAYALAFSLIFLRRFDTLSKFPSVLPAVVLVAIAGQPGGSVGTCLTQAYMGLVAVGAGTLGYFCLAHLGHTRIGQGFVWFIIVYLLSLVKAQSMKFFLPALLAILITFNGLYATTLLRGKYMAQYMYAFVEAYLWGMGIVVAINILVFPTTAERQLRVMLVQAVENLSTFTQLIAKTYSMTITEQEVQLRDQLTQDIRSDMYFFEQKVSDVRSEINWSKFTIEDYTRTISQLKQLQQSLLASYSSLIAMERTTHKSTADVIRAEIAASHEANQAFARLRLGVEMVMNDIINTFAVGKKSYGPLTADSVEDLTNESKDIKDEEASTGVPTLHELSSSESGDLKKARASLTSRIHSELASVSTGAGNGATILHESWNAFTTQQTFASMNLLAHQAVRDDNLTLYTAGPTLKERFDENARAKEGWVPAVNLSSSRDEIMADASTKTIIRNYAFSYGLDNVLEELGNLHLFVVGKVQPKSKNLRFRFFEKSYKPAAEKKSSQKVSLGQAIAKLENRLYVPRQVSFWQKVASIEKWARHDKSIYAFKTACAVIVYTVFLLAPSLQPWYVEYGLTSGLISIVVAMSPTLGNSLLIFGLQITGTTFGTVVGIGILYAFKHVGGFYFNPYGIVALCAVYAIPLVALMTLKPILFAGAFLAMNATGVLVVTEWIYREVPKQIRPNFDSPALRGGKALVAMSIGIAIAAIFQVFILRTPARRQLRLKLASISASLTSYNNVLSVLTECRAPTDSQVKPSTDEDMINIVCQDLIAREGKIQMDILSLVPLMKFSAAEPGFGKPFQVEAITSIIRSQQLILDRMRQARTTLGSGNFDDRLRIDFINQLSPYRAEVKRCSRSLFFFVSTTLAAKIALPSAMPSMGALSKAIQHDAMVLSGRLARHPQGHAVIGSQGFVRIWFYLVSMASVLFHLEHMEPDLRIMFPDHDPEYR